MKYIKLYDTTADMNAAIANSTVGFLGMAYNNGNPVINNVPEPASNTITVNVENKYTYSYVYPGEIGDMTLLNFGRKVKADHPECISQSNEFNYFLVDGNRYYENDTLDNAGVTTGSEIYLGVQVN